jgi:hypothetical protein
LLIKFINKFSLIFPQSYMFSIKIYFPYIKIIKIGNNRKKGGD